MGGPSNVDVHELYPMWPVFRFSVLLSDMANPSQLHSFVLTIPRALRGIALRVSKGSHVQSTKIPTMKISILEKFASDAIGAPATVTGGGGSCKVTKVKTVKCKSKSKKSKSKKCKTSKSKGK